MKPEAEVKKRPEKRQVLWPHTLACEDDGDDVSAETIGLAKFFAYFTSLIVSAGTRESERRAALLNAISNVLKHLPWAEARSFL